MAKLRKRGKVWYSDLTIRGKRVVRALSRDRRIAETKLANLVTGREAEKHGHPIKDTRWDEFSEKYLTHSKSTKSRWTFNHDRRAFRLLTEDFPVIKLSQVTPELLERAKARWKASRGLYVVNRDLRALKAAMRKAEAWGLVSAQRWSSVGLFKEAKGRLKYFSIKELEDLLRVCTGNWKLIVLLGARAGLRRSEIHWLAWEDVDFKNKRIHICGKEGWNPKDFEQRWIPIPEDLLSVLQSSQHGDRWVLADRPSIGSMTNYFKRLVRKAGLEGSIHTLRHTYASHLVSAGVDLYTVSKLLGHASIKTTQIYAHLAPDAMKAAITKLPLLLVATGL